MAKPVMTFGIAVYRAKSSLSRHLPGVVVSQLRAIGVHCNIEPTIVVIPVAITTKPIIHAAMVNFLTLVVKTRR